MRHIRFVSLGCVIFLSILACNFGGVSEQAEDLKSTIEALEETINPDNGPLAGTALPKLPGMTDLTGSLGEEQQLELIGQYGGSSRAMAVNGGIAFFGQGPRVIAVDVSRADQPRFMGQSEVLPGIVEGIILRNADLFAVTLYGGVYRFDVSNPAEIIKLGEYVPEIPGCNAIAGYGDQIYLGCNPGGLRVIDVSDPLRMNETGKSVENGAMIALEVKGNSAYVADLSAMGMAVYDISNPGQPIRTQLITTVDNTNLAGIMSIKMCGEYLCATGIAMGLLVFDLDDPANPTFIGRYPTPAASGFEFIDNRLFLVDDTIGVIVLDISDTGEIKKTAEIPLEMDVWELYVTELFERPVAAYAQRLYVADPVYGITMIDAADADKPERIGYYKPPVPGFLTDISVIEGIAYITGRGCGYRVVDVSDPAGMKELGYDDLRKDLYQQVPTSLIALDDHILITDSDYPLHSYRKRDTAPLEESGRLFDHPASDGAYDMAVSGDYAYLSGWGLEDAFYPGQGIWVVDISDPEDPKAIKFLDVPNERWRLEVRGDMLYALDGSEDRKDKDMLSLRVFDLSDPTNPVEINKLPVEVLPLMPTDVVVAEDRLLVTLFARGVTGYDISDPGNPVATGMLPGVYPSASPNLDWVDPYLIVGGLNVYRVDGSEKAAFIGTTLLPAAWAADLSGNQLFVVTQNQGVYVYRMNR